MAFGSVTVGTTSQASKVWISDFKNMSRNRVTQNFRVPYDADHKSPGEGSEGTPVHFVAMEALVGGAWMQFAIWNNEGKNGSAKGGAFAAKDIWGGGSSDPWNSTRSIKSSPISFLGDTGQSFRMGIIKLPARDVTPAMDWVGFTRSVGFPATGYTQYTASWKDVGHSSDPFYGKVYYNTVPSQPLSAGIAAGGKPSSQILFTWAPPASNGGDSINGYRIEWSQQSDFNPLAGTVVDTKSGTTRSKLVTGLKSGTTYYFRVAALNSVSDLMGAAHSSPWSTTVSGATAAGADVEQLRNDAADQNYLGLRNFQSAYAVQDADGHVVPNDKWLAYGGSVTCQVVGAGQIAMTLVGPSRTIPGYPAPFSFAIENEDGQDRSAITLRGWGATSRPTEVTLATGAAPSVTQTTDTRQVKNVALDTLEQVYERATLALANHGGSVSQISFTISGEKATTFLPGTSFKYDDAVWRVSSMSTSNGSAQVTATMFTTAEQLDAAWGTQTADQRDATLEGVDAEDLNIKPLYGTN